MVVVPLYLCLGGTFWPLHRGHDHLLRTALFRASRLVIGLVSDEMASSRKDRDIEDYGTREAALMKRLTGLMAEAGVDIPFEIHPLDAELGTSEAMDPVEGMVLSRDMEGSVPRLRKLREEAGQGPLEFIFASELLAMDGLPLRATRVAVGETDAEGGIAGTIRVAVGTANDTKVEAVRETFARLFPDNDLEVVGCEVDPGVPDQPRGRQVLEGALNRARNAMAAGTTQSGGTAQGGGTTQSGGTTQGGGTAQGGGTIQGDGGDSGEAALSPPHFGVGIEAGLISNDEVSPTFDVQYCAVVDRGGRVSWGHGPGFVYPDELLDDVAAGKQVREVMRERYWKDPAQSKQGAIHTFSRGHMDRLELTRSAVLMAMVPRISGEHGF